MGHKTEPETIAELIGRARAATRELREAITDSKTREREFVANVDAMRAEAVQYTQKLGRQLVDELVRLEFEHLQDELRRIVVEVEEQVSARAMRLLEMYLQQEIDDAPSIDEMFAARRTLARWQKARGELPTGHARGKFSLELHLGGQVHEARPTEPTEVQP